MSHEVLFNQIPHTNGIPMNPQSGSRTTKYCGQPTLKNVVAFLVRVFPDFLSKPSQFPAAL